MLVILDNQIMVNAMLTIKLSTTRTTYWSRKRNWKHIYK